MKKPVLIPAAEDEAAPQQRLSPSSGQGAIENSMVSARAEKNVSAAARSDTGDEQPRDGGQESIIVERRAGDFSVTCKWTIAQFSRVKARALWSKYFQVGGFDCRLLVYPRGDSQALPGYLSIYLQVTDPRSASSSSKWDCFASYRLSVVNQRDESKSITRDSWHRFSVKKKSHGWCDFSPSSTLLDPKTGFLLNESLVITTEILILNETCTRDSNELNPPSESLSGKFTWKVHNFSLFKEMIKTQKIMSPVFTAGECNLRLSVYQSTVGGVEYLSMCLESKDTEKAGTTGMDRSCWCLFRMSVLNQKPGMSHTHRDSYGRFAGDNKTGDNTSLGWNDYMKMADFISPDMGYLVDDSATFIASFYVIKESSTFTKTFAVSNGRSSSRKSDGFHGKFVWRIDNFTKLKDLLKKRKITGLCIKSRRFQVGGRDCRLIVYPRGQSQPPCHLSMFLEVTDPRSNAADWSCFVSHRLSVVNQRAEDRSVVKESQNRYCKAAKDWGWREFITLTNLFDQDSGFLLQDTVTFSAEVLILKESSTMVEVHEHGDGCPGINRGTFTWKVENFLAFKEIMETRKIFSKFFQVAGCELRIGVYESFDTLCIYLESDQSPSTDPEKNYWVRYRMAVVNQKHTDRTVWKESSICTKTWNNSVLQFMKVSEMVEPDAGFLLRDTIIFVCEILDCCPWFEFSDLEVWNSDDEQDSLSTDPDEMLESDDSDVNSTDEEDFFRGLLARAGFNMNFGDNPQLLLDPSQLQVNLREKLLMDAGAVAAFLTGLRVYLEDPVKVKRLLLPTKASSVGTSKTVNGRSEATSPSLMNLFMGVKVLQQAIVDLLLDIMVECCAPEEKKTIIDPTTKMKVPSSTEDGGGAVQADRLFSERLDHAFDGFTCSQAVQSSDSETGYGVCYNPSDNHANELRWPEQSEELLGLIVNSLRALDGAVPQGCPEPRPTAKSAKKMALVLSQAPKHLQHDLLQLVPKLVGPSEHDEAASALLHWLQKSDLDPALQLSAFSSLTRLEVSNRAWGQILHHALFILPDCRDDSLAIIISCIFKAAKNCYQLPQAAKAIRARLKELGHTVPSKVLDVVRSTICSCMEAGEALLRDIDADCKLNDSEAVFDASCGPVSWRIADVDAVLEMLAVPSLKANAQMVFERAIARGAFSEQSVVMVLERRSLESGGSEPTMNDEFPAIHELARALSRSKDARVREFISTVYQIMFKVYTDPVYRQKMLEGLVERATSSSIHEVELGLEILTCLVRDEEGTARPVLDMMRKTTENCKLEVGLRLQELRATQEELNKARNERQIDLNRLTKEKAFVMQRLSDAEAVQSRLKAELKTEVDRSAREKAECTERLRNAENQLEWVRGERDEERSKHATERKTLQDKIRDQESQLSQLWSRKREDMKRATKEKNALVEKVKTAEASCLTYEEELKRLAKESVGREKMCQSQGEEIRELKEALERSRSDCRAKEQQVAEYETRVRNTQGRLQSWEEYSRILNASLREELQRQAPLYGVGLEQLSLSELDELAQIHDEGLRQVRAFQRRRQGDIANVSHGHPGHHPAVYGLPAIASTGIGGHMLVHGNGRLNGTHQVSSWYPSTS